MINTLIKYKIKGKTKIITESKFNNNGVLFYKNIFEYNLKGNITVKTHYFNKRYWHAKIIYSYDKMDNLFSKNREGYAPSKHSLKYDETGGKIQELISKLDGEPMFIFLFKNDNNGNIIEKNEYGFGRAWFSQYLREEYEYKLSSFIMKKILNQYLNKRLKQILPDHLSKNDWQGGIYRQKIKYIYDENGNVVQELTYDNKAKGFLRFTYNYDERGNKIEECKFSSSLGYKKIFTYDNNENMIECKIFNEDRLLTKKLNCSYEYDLIGNWIKKNKFENENLIEITERKIEYF